MIPPTTLVILPHPNGHPPTIVVAATAIPVNDLRAVYQILMGAVRENTDRDMCQLVTTTLQIWGSHGELHLHTLPDVVICAVCRGVARTIQPRHRARTMRTGEECVANHMQILAMHFLQYA